MRLGLSLLPIIIQALHGQEIHVLRPPRELTGSVNPSSVVSWDADGDGTEEFMAFDPLKAAITASRLSPVEPESSVLAASETAVFNANMVPGSSLFRVDANSDGIDDLVCAGNGRVQIWHGKH